MPSPPPIENELFRFVTLRGPQLLDPDRKSVGFVHHPDLGKSKFFQEADNTLREARGYAARVADRYSPLPGPAALRARNAGLYDFAVWLGAHRATAPAKTLHERAKALTPLTAADRLLVWDNLFYHLQTRSRSRRGQACVLLLLGDYLVRFVEDHDLEALASRRYAGRRDLPEAEDRLSRLMRRLANAAIVIPKTFSHGPAIDVRRRKPVERLPERDSARKPTGGKASGLAQYAEVAVAEKRRARLQKANDELLAIKKKRPGAVKRSLSEVRGKYDDELTEDTRRLLDEPRFARATFGEAHGSVSDDMSRENQRARDGAQSLARKADVAADYCHLARLDTSGKYDRLTLSIKFSSASESIAGGNLTLKQGRKTVRTFKADDIRLMATRETVRTYALLAADEGDLKDGLEYTLAGQLDLSSGEQLTIDLALSAAEPTASACPGKTDDETDDERDQPDISPDPSPNDDYDEWTWDESWDEQMEFYGVNHLGLGIFRRLEQEVCCYVPGEVARIENVMAREYKERTTRSFTSTERVSEDESTFETALETDTSVAVRNELKTEIAKMTEREQATQIGANAEVSGKIFNAEVRTGADLGQSMGTSASTSDREALLYAKEVVNAAAERVTQSMTAKRTTRLLREFEEKNTHGYDNRAGDRHVTGVYRWIDVIYTNKLVNYGAMEMVEFVVPEPARFYKKVKMGGFEPKRPIKPGAKGPKPRHPREYGVNGPSDVTATDGGNNTYYERLAGKYDVVPSPPPPLEQRMDDILTDTGLKESEEKTVYTQAIMIPDGYELHEVEYSGTINYDSTNKKGTNWIIACQGKQWDFDKKGGKNNNRRDYDPEGTLRNYPSGITGSIKASFHYERTRSYTINFVFVAAITSSRLLEWQREVYDDVLAAYQAALAEYESQTDAEEQEQDEKVVSMGTGSSATNRATEKRELKRQAIEMLTEQFGFRVGEDYLTPDGCRIPVLNPEPDKADLNWKAYAAHVKFFEQVFEWELMTYVFYPYYWADRCDWPTLLEVENAGDATFEAFLRSGMARMVVPVRVGFERALNYYFQTGLINNGGNLVLDTSDDLYLSIDEELREPEGTVEETFETRLPTALTIIQGNSVYLDDEGLPCCHDEEEPTEGLIADDALLGVVKD